MPKQRYTSIAERRIDNLRDMLYRLNQLKDPSRILRANLEQEIRRCEERPSTKTEASKPSNAEPAECAQPTLW